MPDDLSLTQTPVGAQLTTVTRPIDHFAEFMYVLCVVLFLVFVGIMQHVHNDSLASKGMDFVYIALGALVQSSQSGAKKS